MSTRTQKQTARSNAAALAAFVSKKAEIDAMLARLQSLSDDHFGYSPDEITWSTRERLRFETQAEADAAADQRREAGHSLYWIAWCESLQRFVTIPEE
jgi:hypothetical protein